MAIFAVDKPLNWTSFDVVAKARKLLKTKKIGHAGTLDPLATGVLVLATDQSTKLIQNLIGQSKDYLALISLGATTATLDAEGKIEEEKKIENIDINKLKEVVNSFLGEQMQLPPMYSAVKVKGVRAYEAARKGQTLELAPKKVIFHRIDFLSMAKNMDEARQLGFSESENGWNIAEDGRKFEFPPAIGDFPTLVIFTSVSSGTYLRALARDIGQKLGIPAHLAGLVRTKVGEIRFSHAVKIENLALDKALA